MNNNFNFYAEYYDLLYKDKDYKSESDYVHGIIQSKNPEAKTILDLGCGTGKHAYEFYLKGYEVTGIDLSDTMLKVAKTLPENSIDFLKADVRNIELNKKFDVVVSLFHVLSYQKTNNDVGQFFKSIKKHLKPNGIFICDFWHGPGVMNDKPSLRKKIFENDKYKIIRIAEPAIHYHQDVVDVNYTVLVLNKEDGKLNEIHETHEMRYFFSQEISLFLRECGLIAEEFREWLSDELPGDYSWNACINGKILK